MQTQIEEQLKGQHYLLVEKMNEWRVYDMSHTHYISIKELTPTLPILVSLVRLSFETTSYPLYGLVQEGVKRYNAISERELDLCG